MIQSLNLMEMVTSLIFVEEISICAHFTDHNVVYVIYVLYRLIFLVRSI